MFLALLWRINWCTLFPPKKKKAFLMTSSLIIQLQIHKCYVQKSILLLLFCSVYNANFVCCMEYPNDIQHLLKCAVFMLGTVSHNAMHLPSICNLMMNRNWCMQWLFNLIRLWRTKMFLPHNWIHNMTARHSLN